jgi:hypothetical protein
MNQVSRSPCPAPERDARAGRKGTADARGAAGSGAPQRRLRAGDFGFLAAKPNRIWRLAPGPVLRTRIAAGLACRARSAIAAASAIAFSGALVAASQAHILPATDRKPDQSSNKASSLGFSQMVTCKACGFPGRFNSCAKIAISSLDLNRRKFSGIYTEQRLDGSQFSYDVRGTYVNDMIRFTTRFGSVYEAAVLPDRLIANFYAKMYTTFARRRVLMRCDGPTERVMVRHPIR